MTTTIIVVGVLVLGAVVMSLALKEVGGEMKKYADSVLREIRENKAKDN